MPMTQTHQGAYATFRADVSSSDTALDGATAGYGYDFSDKPAAAQELPPDCNAVEIYFTGHLDINQEMHFTLWGYAARGPAEFMVKGYGETGTAEVGDLTTEHYVDTLDISTQAHIKTAAVADSGNNRIAKLSVDTTGLKFLYPEFTSVAVDATDIDRIRSFIRYF